MPRSGRRARFSWFTNARVPCGTPRYDPDIADDVGVSAC